MRASANPAFDQVPFSCAFRVLSSGLGGRRLYGGNEDEAALTLRSPAEAAACWLLPSDATHRQSVNRIIRD